MVSVRSMQMKGKIVLGILGFIALLFILEATGLGLLKVFGPARENIKREIFENTQSYVQGKTQQLAKYKHEWDAANDTTRAAIEGIIRIQFAELDETKIQSLALRKFLTDTRGF